ncbi:unnamed protein product [Tilletia laevis]|uniref:Uncharacterized protein n=1 Tax=Tilletia laevis TaxID=157183 RepID=A0A9N8QK90_9BASI|nr:unnamed protein product [Tilletia caries]CAD6954507.1 unnamed protein product [Tilletia laevis]
MDTAEYQQLQEQHDSLLVRYTKLCRSYTDQRDLLQRKRIEIARLQGGWNSLLTRSAAGLLPLVSCPLPATLSSGALPALHPAVDYHQSSPLSDTLRSRLSFDSPSDQSVDFAATGTAQPQEEDSTFAGSPCHIPSPSSTLIPQYRQDYPHLEASSPYPSKLQVVDLEAKLHQQSSDFAQLQHRYRQLSRSFNESLSREAVLERFVVRERLRLSPEPPLPSSGTDTTNASSSYHSSVSRHSTVRHSSPPLLDVDPNAQDARHLPESPLGSDICALFFHTS